jgi:hypothetical protein
MTYENRNYIIFNVSELNKVNFSEVLEDSSESVRKSIDLSKTFVKWEGTTPSFVSTLTTAEGPYTYTEIISILEGAAWTNNQI